jgi:hypothetical protein
LEAKSKQLANLFKLNESLEFKYLENAYSKRSELFEQRVESVGTKYTVKSTENAENAEFTVKFDQIVQDLKLKNYDTNHKASLSN